MRLDPQRGDKVLLDAICVPTLGPAEHAQRKAERRIIAVVDFNYLDSAGRSRAAAALDWFADHAGENGDRIKVYSITRQVRLLTPGFTTDTQQIRQVAELVRAEHWRRTPVGGLGGDAFRVPEPGEAQRTENQQGGDSLRTF